LIDRIPDRLTELALGKHDLLLSVQPVLECVHQRQTFLHSCLITFLNGEIFDLSFDHEQLGEEGKTLAGSRFLIIALEPWEKHNPQTCRATYRINFVLFGSFRVKPAKLFQRLIVKPKTVLFEVNDLEFVFLSVTEEKE
jgi:hypothetical protein